TEFFDLLGCGSGTRLEDNGCLYRLSDDPVRHSYHSCVEHLWAVEDHILQLERVDLLPTSVDHIFLAVKQVKEAFLIEFTYITGVKPTIRSDRCLCRFLVLPVPFRDFGTSDHYFA